MRLPGHSRGSQCVQPLMQSKLDGAFQDLISWGDDPVIGSAQFSGCKADLIPNIQFSSLVASSLRRRVALRMPLSSCQKVSWHAFGRSDLFRAVCSVEVLQHLIIVDCKALHTALEEVRL